MHEDDRVVAFLDRAPLIKGHVLVVTRAHVGTFDELAPDMLEPLFGVVQRVSRAFRSALGADGSYTAINTRVSQSVPHVHVHVVPRRRGDSLFQPGRSLWTRRRYAEGQAEEIAEQLRRELANPL